ncbi:MAG: FAD-linked oxidase C-terminal domain-containing protein [Planctomycetota bacterium]
MPELPVLREEDIARFERDRQAIARDLSNAISGEVRFSAHDRGLYATDASIYQVEPIGVVVPDSVDDAAAAVRFCAGRGIPMLPRGGGTSLAGQCVNRSVVIDVSARCRGVTRVNAEEKWCEAFAGTTIDELNRHLGPTGLFFAPDPSTVRQANIGGCIGNNAAGTRSIRYGRTSESVLAVDAILASGERVRFDRGAATRDPIVRRITADVVDIVRRHEGLIRERFPKTLRRNAGYGLDLVLSQLDEPGDAMSNADLAPLLCGSEGTLALTAGARLKLHRFPTHRALAVLGFPSVDAAVAMVPALLEARPGAVELLDDLVISLARKNIEYRRYVDLMPQPGSGELAAVLYVEVLGFGDEEVDEAEAAIRTIASGAPLAFHRDETAMAQALKLRQAGEPLLHAIPGDRKPLGFVEDNAVPVEHLGEFVELFRAICEAHGTRAAFYAHASVGVLHVRPLLDLRSESDRRATVEIATEVADLAKSLGGVMSGEHGDGRARGPFIERYFGPELMRAFREVKAAFDPQGLLNPGNIVDPGPPSTIVEKTRIHPRDHEARVPQIETHYRFADQDGFAHAIERCNGAGVCRKTSGGTMCPSYIATLDERHSTRGRGNALRLAITGQFGDSVNADRSPNWNDPETTATLDLCLSCKACKTECPSNVDISRLKAEYQAQSYAASGGAPLAARVFGHVRRANRMGAMLPRLSNAIGRLAPVRMVMNRVLGLSPHRSLPAFSVPLPKRLPRSAPGVDSARPVVLLYGDCFSTYNESDIGVAAATLLRAFGYRVEYIDAGCCGRAMMSTGLLPEAIRSMERGAVRLRDALRRHDAKAILVLEPSCLSAITDDWLDLRSDLDMSIRQEVADASMLVEQFLESAWDEHPRHPEFRSDAGPVTLHGHCHQKALWGAGSSADLLRRALGDDAVTVPDTGCCGMAGSFGYIDSKYDLSMRIGELTVFPAVRATADDAAVVAPGTSCRHQILDGTGREAVHPVTLLAQRLAPESRIDRDDHAPLFAR